MAFVELVREHRILSALVGLLLLAYAYHIVFIERGPSEPPLIKGYFPFIGAAPQALLSPAEFLLSCKRRYGDIFTVYALGSRVHIVSDPIDGVPAVFRKSKQLSFKAGLKHVYIKALGVTGKRLEEEELDKEHFAMIPPYLLATSAVDELTVRFMKFLLRDIRRQIDVDPKFKEGKTIELFDWASARLFLASGPALYGDGIFDGAETILEDFRTFDDMFAMRIALPMWMTKSFAIARTRIQNVLGPKFAEGLRDPSSFVKKRIEIQERYGYELDTIGRDLLGITFALMTNAMPIVFWYITYILTSEKYYPLVMERVRSYAIPYANLNSENIFIVPALLSDPLLQACFQETLRLRTQNGSVRIVNETTTIPIRGREYLLRQESIVFILAPLIHMDTDIYSQVEEYHPERFMGADIESTLVHGDQPHLEEEIKKEKSAQSPKFYKNGVQVKHYMMPFGGGDNLCTGRRYAQNEILALACTLLYLFEFENPIGGKIVEPAKPAGKRFGVGAEGPGKAYLIKMRLRE